MPRRDEAIHEQLSERINARVNERLLETVGGPTSPPDGVVTIVFTDVEGSSALVRELGDQRAHQILRRHDETLRRVLAEHNGLEIERAGDGFMLAFRSPTKAVAFTLVLHEPLPKDGDVRVRIGLDSGEVIREEKGYFGRTVFRAPGSRTWPAPGGFWPPMRRRRWPTERTCVSTTSAITSSRG